MSSCQICGNHLILKDASIFYTPLQSLFPVIELSIGILRQSSFSDDSPDKKKRKKIAQRLLFLCQSCAPTIMAFQNNPLPLTTKNTWDFRPVLYASIVLHCQLFGISGEIACKEARTIAANIQSAPDETTIIDVCKRAIQFWNNNIEGEAQGRLHGKLLSQILPEVREFQHDLDRVFNTEFGLNAAINNKKYFDR